MKNHKLGFVIANREDEEEYPQFRATINGDKQAVCLLILPLELSAKQDGLYPILNCTCGEWGCGGYYVGVKNTEEHVIWEGVYGLVDRTKKRDVLSATIPIYFLRKEYEALINELLILKDKYKWEANVYKVDKEQYNKGGLESLEYIREY